MGWFVLILVLIAIALGILGTVVKTVAIVVLTVIFSILALGAIAYFTIRHRARRFMNDIDHRRQLPS